MHKQTNLKKIINAYKHTKITTKHVITNKQNTNKKQKYKYIDTQTNKHKIVKRI